MTDPLSALKKSLNPVFVLSAAIYAKNTTSASVIQELENAIEHYDATDDGTLIHLQNALRESLRFIKKQWIDFDHIKRLMDKLARSHKMPKINWDQILSNPSTSHRFQFSVLNHSPNDNDSLSVLIHNRSGKPYEELTHTELTQALIDLREVPKFNDKLHTHLKSNPDFLYNLIVGYKSNFIKILSSPLSLYLTDEQIAKAIIKHIPALMNKEKNTYEQVEQLVDKLNEILSYGRSVSTLLNSPQAKSILDTSEHIQIYQSDEYKERNTFFLQPLIPHEQEVLKPGF